MISQVKSCSAMGRMKKESDKKFELKRKVKKPSLIECIFNKRYTDRSVYYFTTGTGVNKDTMRDVSKEPTPFWFPPDTQGFSYNVVYKVLRQRFREEQAQYNVRTKPSYRTRQNMDLLKRLYIPDEEIEDLKEPGLLDIDPQFFKIIEGRPIKQKLDIRKYLDEVRDTLKTRLEVGYQLDEAMQIEDKFVEEQRRFNEIQARHKLYSDNFDEFLEKDHETSMALLEDAKNENVISAEKSSELKELEKKYGTIKCQVIILEETWRNSKMFQKFLYLVSPMYWRKKHDYMNRKRISSVSLVSEMSTLFERYQTSLIGSSDSLDALLDVFVLDIRTSEEPILYFTKTNELCQIFQEMEMQNLNSLLHSEELSDPISSVKRGLEEIKQKFGSESAYISGKIKDLDTAITWEEERARSLENKSKELLNGPFKELVVAESALKLGVFVEDVYETCIAPNDSNLGLYTMMRGIESKMEFLLLKLDYLPFDVVKFAETETYEEEARVMKEAEEAESKVKLMEKLKWRLRRAFEPPTYSRGKPLKQRSEPPPMKKKAQKPPKPLSDQEKDFLNFFTDYCHHVDDVRDYFPLKWK